LKLAVEAVECLFICISELKRVGHRPTFKRIGEWDPVHADAVVKEAQAWEVMFIQEALTNVLLLEGVVDDC
jgi:hypothetical protein